MTFVSRAALVLHLESGSCVSGIDRRTVNALVKRYDTNNLITDRLLTTGRGEDEIQYIATGASWNGVAYECYLCYKPHRTLHALNQHLNSPKHAQKFYLCRGPNCGVKFSALSALVQHIESQKCGVAKFSVVQNAMDSVLGQMGRLTL
ncbi:hypothetical protein D9619_002468 [Psilocybe cf. subviscida]|uniref:C2H2-type domain-containing protein n=1 Tax=Psilocybe cf. subviscida TaxID=2480587 RepID=A0A8H5AZ37_9AGAR|nr:hypothetical protein D9619_002468 [Psilocybe cf. subviscida]